MHITKVNADAYAMVTVMAASDGIPIPETFLLWPVRSQIMTAPCCGFTFPPSRPMPGRTG